MKRRVFLLSASIAAVCLLLLPLSGQADLIIDLTTPASSGTDGIAYFQQINPSSTGTGVIQSFVRISANTDVVQGYNTGGRPLQLNENPSPNFTTNLLLADVPIVSYNGGSYREFLLDINQEGNAPLLSLDQIRIYLSNTKDLNPTDPAGLGNLIYSLDPLDPRDGNNWVKLDYSLNTGSGSGDMFMYIPISLFLDRTYVYLYSQFGTNFPNNDGFEEWAVREAGTPIPEPVSMLLFGTGLVGIGGYVRRRFKK